MNTPTVIGAVLFMAGVGLWLAEIIATKGVDYLVRSLITMAGVFIPLELMIVGMMILVWSWDFTDSE